MNQYDYFSMDAMGRSMYDAQQAAVDSAHEALRGALFGQVKGNGQPKPPVPVT